MADAKRLAKNTLYMYLRMIIVMLILIYTSRVVLDKLGVDDYGLYNAVASVVGVMVFLNQTLSTSTSRFLTYELGKGGIDRLSTTFSTSFLSHLMLALLIVLIMETLGCWYIANKFVIPEGREFATRVVFQLSIISVAISVCQVPFTASVMAHEDLNIYAWVGVFEVIIKLLIVYLLSISPIDKLIFYASLGAAAQFLITGMYVVFCWMRYEETLSFLKFNPIVFKNMLGFTGWTAVANVSNTMIVQGAVVLLNLFWAPAIIAAKALADQITQAIMGLVNNFRVALNPQIIKSYAAGNNDETKTLTLKSVVISFDLLLVIGLPCVLVMDTILSLWLVKVPPYAVAFSRIAIFSQIVNTISTSTYIPFIASGKQKRNALWGVVCGLGYFIMLYVIYKLGGDVLWVQYLYLINVFISIFILRPYLLRKELVYKLKDLFSCYWECFKVLISSLVLCGLLYCVCDKTFLMQLLLLCGSFIICIFCSFIFMERSMRNQLLNIFHSIRAK